MKGLRYFVDDALKVKQSYDSPRPKRARTWKTRLMAKPGSARQERLTKNFFIVISANNPAPIIHAAHDLVRPHLSRIENGHTVPSVETLEKLARGLEVPLYQLFYEGEEPPALPRSRNRRLPRKPPVATRANRPVCSASSGSCSRACTRATGSCCSTWQEDGETIDACR